MTPYRDKEEAEWLGITSTLVKKHPLGLVEIRDITIASWDELWRTKIGSGKSAFALQDMCLPATVVGHFFEKLFLRNLASKYPEHWRGPREKSSKDIVYIPNNEFSIEMKCSGQLGLKVFGNRSYGQQVVDPAGTAKSKSGYYITVNFYETNLTLVRFGWIDHADWQAQKAQTGQMAGLSEKVYKNKLVNIHGDYQLRAPIQLLPRVGKKTALTLAKAGITQVKDILAYRGDDRKILQFKKPAQEFLGKE